MLIQHLDPLASSLFSLLAIGSLLLSFVMLGSRWLKNYLYAFAAESWVIAALSAAVGYYGNYPELYLIAILTLLFRGLLLPYLIWRIINRLKIGREIHEVLQPSSGLVIGALFVMFALAVSYRVAGELQLETTVAVLALTVMLSMKLIGFLMLAVRHEAISQVLGLLVLENGIFLGSQILVPGMPLLIELVILFDLLIIVACFGVLVSYLVDACRQSRAPSISSGSSADGRRIAAGAVDRPARGAGRLSRAAPRRGIWRGAEPDRRVGRPRRRAATCRSLPGARRCCSGATMSWSTGPRPGSLLCTAIVYFLASIYAVGYMRLLGEDERLSQFYALFAGFAADHARRPADEQYRRSTGSRSS